MRCAWTCVVILALAIVGQAPCIALPSQSESVALAKAGEPSCRAHFDEATVEKRNIDQLYNDSVSGVKARADFETAKAGGNVEDDESTTGCQFVSSVIGLVEQYAAHLDLSYVNLIVRDLPLARAMCRAAAWRFLAGGRRAVRITCSHLHGAWRSSQESGLRGLTVAVLLPAGRLRPVLQRRATAETLLVVSRDRPAPPTRIPPDIGWIHAQLRPSNCTADISEVWTFPNGQQPLTEPQGHWSAADGLSLRWKGAAGPGSFQGRTVRFATSNASGDVIYDAANNRILRKNGFYGDLIRLIEKELQLRAEIVLPSDEQPCADPDDVLCGPLGLLRRRQAEVAVGHFRIQTGNLDIVDFTTALQDYSYNFVVANPNRQTSAAAVNWRAYSEPFTAPVWLCSAAMAVLVWLAWCLVQWADRGRLPAPAPAPAQTAWSVLCITLQQGAELVPHSISARQLVGCFWLFCVILLASYTSNIISLLVSVGKALPFSSLGELGARRGWLVAVQPNSPAAALLQGRPELDNHQIIYQPSLKDSLERIINDDKFTVFTGHTEAEHLVRGSCSLAWTPIRLGVTHAHWALQKHLPYGARISNVLGRLVEAGVVSRSQRPWAVSDEACRLPTASFQTISLRHTLTAFMLLALGTVASVAVLCGELLHRRDAPFLSWEPHPAHPDRGRPATGSLSAPGDPARPARGPACLGRQSAAQRRDLAW